MNEISAIHEVCQKLKWTIAFSSTHAGGPAHDPRHAVTATISGETLSEPVTATIVSGNLKLGRQKVAKELLQHHAVVEAVKGVYKEPISPSRSPNNHFEFEQRAQCRLQEIMARAMSCACQLPGYDADTLKLVFEESRTISSTNHIVHCAQLTIKLIGGKVVQVRGNGNSKQEAKHHAALMAMADPELQPYVQSFQHSKSKLHSHVLALIAAPPSPTVNPSPLIRPTCPIYPIQPASLAPGQYTYADGDADCDQADARLKEEQDEQQQQQVLQDVPEGYSIPMACSPVVIAGQNLPLINGTPMAHSQQLPPHLSSPSPLLLQQQQQYMQASRDPYGNTQHTEALGKRPRTGAYLAPNTAAGHSDHTVVMGVHVATDAAAGYSDHTVVMGVHVATDTAAGHTSGLSQAAVAAEPARPDGMDADMRAAASAEPARLDGMDADMRAAVAAEPARLDGMDADMRAAVAAEPARPDGMDAVIRAAVAAEPVRVDGVDAAPVPTDSARACALPQAQPQAVHATQAHDGVHVLKTREYVPSWLPKPSHLATVQQQQQPNWIVRAVGGM